MFTVYYDVIIAEWLYNKQPSDEIGHRALKARVCEFRRNRTGKTSDANSEDTKGAP